MKGTIAPATLHMHLAALDLLAEWAEKDYLMDEFTIKDMEGFKAHRLEMGISKSTANKELKVLKRVFNLAHGRGYLPNGSNPCVGVPMSKIGKKRIPYCSSEEFHALYGAARDPMWRALLAVIYTTGIRRNEALNLTWGDIDFGAGIVHITRRDASSYVQAWTPKDHELRGIPIPSEVVNVLAEWQGAAPEGCPYVFMDPGRWEYYRQQVDQGQWREGQHLVNNLLRKFTTIRRRAGVGEYTLHDLRRSCITNWVKKGVPIHVVQMLAGHADIKTTQGYYLSVQDEDVVKAKTAQASVVGELPTPDPTDPKVTHSVKTRVFPGRQGCQPKKEALGSQGLA